MKYVFSLIFLSVFISCEKEQLEEFTISNDYLSVAGIKDYLPSSYFNGVDIVYKNEEGDEWKLSTKPLEYVSGETIKNISYQAEQIEITLYDPNEITFSITIIGAANYVESGAIITHLNCILMPFNDSGSTWNSITFEEGQPVVSFGDDFREVYQAHGKEFKNTFVTIGTHGNVQHDAYSELNINSEQGVVAFRDGNNDLWVFDRIVE